jgi:hypothetical protein
MSENKKEMPESLKVFQDNLKVIIKNAKNVVPRNGTHDQKKEALAQELVNIVSKAKQICSSYGQSGNIMEIIKNSQDELNKEIGTLRAYSRIPSILSEFTANCYVFDMLKEAIKEIAKNSNGPLLKSKL